MIESSWSNQAGVIINVLTLLKTGEIKTSSPREISHFIEILSEKAVSINSCLHFSAGLIPDCLLVFILQDSRSCLKDAAITHGCCQDRGQRPAHRRCRTTLEKIRSSKLVYGHLSHTMKHTQEKNYMDQNSMKCHKEYYEY